MIDIGQVDPFMLPSVEIEKIENLPKVEGVYFAIAEEKILYIGKSVNLHQRWQTHHRTVQIESYDGARIAWLSLEDSKEQNLDRLELECIWHFRPILNETVMPNEFATDRANRGTTSIHIPAQMKGELKSLAKRNNRSMKKEILRAIMLYIEHEKYGYPCRMRYQYPPIPK